MYFPFSIILYRIKQVLLRFAESTGNCGQWRQQTEKCLGGDEADADACCKEQGVPYECTYVYQNHQYVRNGPNKLGSVGLVINQRRAVKTKVFLMNVLLIVNLHNLLKTL